MSRRCAAPLMAVVALLPVMNCPAFAQMGSAYETREERQIYSPDAAGSGGGSVLDATNPMDLLNRIRRSTAMDDATPPSDAVDAALKAYQQP
jgi:hypothetical protein